MTPPRPPAQLPPLSSSTTTTAPASNWKLKQQQEERAEREAAQAVAAVRTAQLHSFALHCFQVHSQSHALPGSGTAAAAAAAPPGEATMGALLGATRLAVLLFLKAGEANQRQVLCVTGIEEESLVLKTCATDTLGEAHAEHMTGKLAQRLGIETPLVRVSRRVRPLQAALTALEAQGRIVALPSQALQLPLWSPPALATPFVYVMRAAKGKTLLELRPEERQRLRPHSVLPALGRQAALDALINNWDRWPLPTLWQKSREWLAKGDADLAAACRPLGQVGAMSTEGEEAALRADDLLRGCGCNLGNVLFHVPSGAIASIDTCIIGGVPADYAERLGAMVDTVASAYDEGRADEATRVMLAVLAAALRLDERGVGQGECAAAERCALLQRGFLEGIVAAAEQLGEVAVFNALEAETLANTLIESAEPPDAAVAKHVKEARQLVERNVAACRLRLTKLKQVQLEKRARSALILAPYLSLDLLSTSPPPSISPRPPLHPGSHTNVPLDLTSISPRPQTNLLRSSA